MLRCKSASFAVAKFQDSLREISFSWDLPACPLSRHSANLETFVDIPERQRDNLRGELLNFKKFFDAPIGFNAQTVTVYSQEAKSQWKSLDRPNGEIPAGTPQGARKKFP